jgi:hypothetical protein
MTSTSIGAHRLVLSLALLAIVSGCEAADRRSRRPTERAPIEGAAPEPSATSEPDATSDEPEAPTAFTAYCYVATRDSSPGHFSGCFTSETQCRALLYARRRMFEELGFTLHVSCAVAEAPHCAVATDASGQITYRSCAIDAATCEEQRLRAVEAIANGMVSGPEPSCRPATEEDVARRGDRAPGLIGP